MKKWNIGWGTTSLCNMKCKFCYSKLHRNETNDLGLKEWVHFVDDNHKYINSINYGTGENSISDDWFSLIAHIRTKYPEIRQALTTNGYTSKVNATDMLIVDAYRNLAESSASISKRFHVSDTYAHDVFDRYVKLDRLPLTDAISVDEVFLDMDDNCKYALVIQDFHTGEPIDLLRSRRMNVTEPYFTSIPPEERNSVKFLISDMYNPYISYVDKYFPNAVPIVDSFHVLQWVTRSIDNYMRQLLKKYKQRDRELQEQLTTDPLHPVQLPISDEVYILQKYRWLILSNQSNIHYHSDPRMDQHFHVLMNTYDYEDWLFRIDSNLKDFRDLKEQYVLFNSRNGGNPIAAHTEIDELIVVYKKSSYEMFRDFAKLLEKYKDPIINSFIMVEKVGNGKIYDSRLSNGPIESINRKVKDLKRLGRGFRNFKHFRNRFLYATRSAPVLNGVSDYNPVTYFEEDEF